MIRSVFCLKDWKSGQIAQACSFASLLEELDYRPATRPANFNGRRMATKPEQREWGAQNYLKDLRSESD